MRTYGKIIAEITSTLNLHIHHMEEPRVSLSAHGSPDISGLQLCFQLSHFHGHKSPASCGQNAEARPNPISFLKNVEPFFKCTGAYSSTATVCRAVKAASRSSFDRVGELKQKLGFKATTAKRDLWELKLVSPAEILALFSG